MSMFWLTMSLVAGVGLAFALAVVLYLFSTSGGKSPPGLTVSRVLA